MPLKRISHDDTNHFGSAKRDIASGVAGLDASKEVINNVPVSKLVDMDEQSFINLIDNGDFKSWPDGDSSNPERWFINGTGATVEIETTIVKTVGNSAKVTYGSVGCDINQDFPYYAKYTDKTVTMSCWVYCSTPGIALIRIWDGNNLHVSEIHSGGGGWELLTVEADLGGLTVLRMQGHVESAGFAYFSGAILVEGYTCPAFSPKPISFIGWESLPPFLDENSANVANKPTLITRGLFGGYSLPEYAANEELLFRMRVPHCWDGSSNPWFVCITSASAVEDIGDKYKFQLEWQAEDIESVIPDTTAETLTDEITLTDGSAFYANIAVFELDGSLLTAGENLQMRLRRIAASASSVTNEVIVWHWDTRWKMNKIGTSSIQGY